MNQPQTTDFRSLVESLARTIPEAANPGLPVQPAQPLSIRSDPKPPNSGILALASEVSMLERKLRTVDEGVQLTDKLAQFSDNLRAPLTGFVNQAVQSGDLAADNLQSRDPGRLRQQTASLDQLTDEITRLAPAMAALDKQRVLLTVYKSRLTQLAQHRRQRVHRRVEEFYSAPGRSCVGDSLSDRCCCGSTQNHHELCA